MKSIFFETLNSSASSYQKILKLVKFLDKAYIPPLSKTTDLSDYTQKIFNHADIIIARNNKLDLGFIAIYCNDLHSKIAYITSLGVKKDYYRLGIGQALIQQALMLANQKNMATVRLEVTKVNKKAIRLYQKIGFVFTDISPKNCHNSYIMEYILPKSLCL
jgi:ribosomal protein S18 acetylase RimI-like enzyme